LSKAEEASARVVAVSGTPGVGKTLVARHLAEALGAEVVELSEVALREGLYVGYDEKTLSYVIDEARVRRYLRSLATKGRVVVVVGHYSEIVDDDILEKLFVIRLNPVELLERLRRRGWPQAKVLDNVEAELLGVCTANALAEHPRSKVCEVDASGKEPEEVSREIVEILRGVRECRVFVDWLEREDVVRGLLATGLLALQGREWEAEPGAG